MEKLGKKLKHDHTLTSILKFAIFSLIMLAPIFSVASRCLYVICNKNAKDSYSDNYVNKLTLVNNTSMEIVGNEYLLQYDSSLTNSGTSQWVYFSSTSIDFTQFTGVNFDVIGYRIYDNGRYIYLADSGNVQHNINTTTEEIVSIMNNKTITYQSGTGMSSSGYKWYFNYYLITYTTNKLDNAFEYSLSQLEQSSYYNWATNLGIYTPIHNMTSGLGAHDIVALLLAYWSIYTAIYIVFDIIIACFVKITHLLQSE